MCSRLAGSRLASPQDPTGGVWTAASASHDRVDVLVSSFLATGGSDRSVHVDVAGMAPGLWTASLYRVDADHPGSTDPAETVNAMAAPNGRVTLDTTLPAQSIALVELARPAERAASVAGEQVLRLEPWNTTRWSVMVAMPLSTAAGASSPCSFLRSVVAGR